MSEIGCCLRLIAAGAARPPDLSAGRHARESKSRSIQFRQHVGLFPEAFSQSLLGIEIPQSIPAWPHGARMAETVKAKIASMTKHYMHRCSWAENHHCPEHFALPKNAYIAPTRIQESKKATPKNDLSTCFYGAGNRNRTGDLPLTSLKIPLFPCVDRCC